MAVRNLPDRIKRQAAFNHKKKMEEEMKNTFFVLLAVICCIFIETGIASADCPDTTMTCYAFCNDGPREETAPIGTCYSGIWPWGHCYARECASFFAQSHLRDICDNVFKNKDASCVVLRAITHEDLPSGYNF